MSIPKIHMFSHIEHPKNAINEIVLSKCLRWKWVSDDDVEIPLITKDAALVTCIKCLQTIQIKNVELMRCDSFEDDVIE